MMTEEEFIKKTNAEIRTIQKAYGLSGKYRQSTSYVSYSNYLTPPVGRLDDESRRRIFSNPMLALKEKNDLLPDDQVLYEEIFNFDPTCIPLNALSGIMNILRGLYELSFRYSDSKLLLDKCEAFIVGYRKFFKFEGQEPQEHYWTLDFISTFFKINTKLQMKFMGTLLRELSSIDMNINTAEQLSVSETDVLKDFMYICPYHATIPDKMTNFYKDLFNRVNNQDLDTFDTAAWVIKAVCDIHPFADGNGRVARTLAFRLIRDKIGVEFTQNEIQDFGEDDGYNKATSRMNYMPHDKVIAQIKSWLQSVIFKKDPKIYFRLSKNKLDAERTKALLFSISASVSVFENSDVELIQSQQLMLRCLYDVNADPDPILTPADTTPTRRDKFFPRSVLF